MLRLNAVFRMGAALFLVMAVPGQANTEDLPPLAATVVSVEGQGTAKARKKIGTESVLAQAQQLFAGDRIMTDEQTVVQLMLPDGSIIRVGARSEYIIESAEQKGGFVAWAFQLTRGTVRALVEKDSNKKDVKFRVNTPAGTMGVRGTELLLTHDPVSETTTLFTFEGQVEFGALACDRQRTCLMVKAGETSSVSKTKRVPLPVKKIGPDDLAGLMRPATSGGQGTESKMAGAAEQGSSILSVMRPDADKRNGSAVVDLEDEALAQMVLKTSRELQAQQDVLMDRDETTRVSMHQAMDAGTFEQRIQLAQKQQEESPPADLTPEQARNVKVGGAAKAERFRQSQEILGKASAAKAAAADPLRQGIQSKKTAVDLLAEKMLGQIDAAEAATAAKASALSKSGSGASSVRGVGESKEVLTALAQAIETLKESSTKIQGIKHQEAIEKAAANKVAENKAAEAANAKAEAKGSAPAEKAKRYQEPRCAKVVVCQTRVQACRLEKGAQHTYCEKGDEATAAYLAGLARKQTDITTYYSFKPETKEEKAIAKRAGIREVSRDCMEKKKKCKVEVVPCTAKAAGGTCKGKEHKQVCYDEFVKKRRCN